MEKKCCHCKELLPFEMFHKNVHRDDGLQTHCKSCSKERSKRYYQENKEKHRLVTKGRRNRIREEYRVKFDMVRSRGCCLCGENDPVCIDFHHLDPKTKKFNIANAVRSELSWSLVVEEINKCVLLCANCHRRVHANKVSVSKSFLCCETVPIPIVM